MGYTVAGNELETNDEGYLLEPGAALLGYVKSDHWAVALPFNRSTRSFWNRLLRNHNAFPREVLFEAILRYVEDDLQN